MTALTPLIEADFEFEFGPYRLQPYQRIYKRDPELTEIWSLHPVHTNYIVSSFGRIRGPSGKILKPRIQPNGYGRVSVSINQGPQMDKFIHRLVCETFIGPAPEGYQCDHADRDRMNNKLSNLSWVSLSENIAKRKDVYGSEHWNSKLTEDDVLRIRASTESSIALGKEFDVNPSTIRAIRRGGAWKHVPFAERDPENIDPYGPQNHPLPPFVPGDVRTVKGAGQ